MATPWHSTGNLPRLVKLDKLLMQAGGFLGVKHRALSACNHDRVKSLDIDFCSLLRRLNHSRQRGSRDKTHADQIASRIPARVARIAHRIRLALPPVRTEDFDLIPLFG